MAFNNNVGCLAGDEWWLGGGTTSITMLFFAGAKMQYGTDAATHSDNES